MMDTYGTPIDSVRNYNLDPKEVIKGLNGYYELDTHDNYITVKRNDVEGPAYLYAPIYLSALIEWLREDFDIFYRPGLKLDQVEAARSAAKMCGLRAHIKDEICKRGLWCGADADIPELVDILFKAYDECSKARDRNREDAVKLSEVSQELRKELNTLKDNTGIYCSKSYISDRIHEICTAKGIELDDAFLYNDDYTWEDLVGFLCEEIRKLKKEIKEVNDKRWKDLYDIHKALGYDGTYDNTDEFAIAVKARAECVKRALGEESDINALIRDYCTKNDIIAPSRYFSDEACIEYLFSVVDLKQKNRAAVILQDLYRDIFKKQPDGLLAEDIATKILDKVLETEDLLHKSVDSVNEECKATGKLMVDDYKLKLKNYILKDIKEHGYRYGGLETKSIEEIVDWIITMATCPRNEWAKDEIENLRGQISRLKDLINAMNEEVKDM